MGAELHVTVSGKSLGEIREEGHRLACDFYASTGLEPVLVDCYARDDLTDGTGRVIRFSADLTYRGDDTALRARGELEMLRRRRAKAQDPS